ncbi:MAG: hypothetical protein FJ109_09065 [Deltaproteobacteria bacterium]|nr:hypothetical protein [Deltaproteobacteria bacterium]
MRRMLEALGLVVVRLSRVRFAGLDVGGLAPGDFRELAADEVEMLRRACHAAGAPHLSIKQDRPAGELRSDPSVESPSRPPHSRGS